ncbi:MAG: glutamate-5-semialdehyde dehydrogenase [Turicibacter sp.]|nr:glutamate-5-semialdehyde dehydrogenase [Turicibacter sp.]
MSELIQKSKRLKKASKSLGLLSTEEKNMALKAIAAQLVEEKAFILAENSKDMEAGRAKGFDDTLLDRLMLTGERIDAIAEGVLQVVDLEDPIGEVREQFQRPNGLSVKQVAVPLGVIGMIYEARPNVTVDAAVLCLKSGNSVLLRGSSSAVNSNKALVAVMHRGLEKADTIPLDALALLEDTSRETAREMFNLNEYLDVLIPRGGAGLIQSVIKEASVPVLETGVGNCHIFIDESADADMAIDIVINAKTQRPSVCNAAETVLVHEGWSKLHLPKLLQALHAKNVQVYGDAPVLQWDETAKPAQENHWQDEFLSLDIAIGTVDGVQAAMDHIDRYGSKHSEAIITQNSAHALHFLNGIDAAAVYHNASTRFTDGFEFGFGAEIGISTQKLHARGPMGLKALTSTKYLIYGNGQIR